MEHEHKKPCEIIKMDRYTGMVKMPKLLLMNRSFHVIRDIPFYDNWRILLLGNGLDEIIFDVHKYINGRLCPVWDEITDLKIVDVEGFGRFEITVDCTDGVETVKSVHGFSLEAELAQVGLHEFHVNDEEAADMEITEYSKDNYDSDGNFIPTTFYNPDDEKHSLLHRVLADKAPHWGIGYVTPWIALDGESQPEESCKFQRTYTANGETVYDFLTGTVAEESNVVFIFDTVNRLINCYSLCDCTDQETGETLCKGVGDDTFIYIDKENLAFETTVSSDRDGVKNCFRIEGGDDVITDMVRAVNMNGSNYIYQFADFQYSDMSGELRGRIKEYQEMMSSKETQDAYYGNGDVADAFLGGSMTLQVSSELDALYVLNICKNNNIKTESAGTGSNGYDWTSCYVAALPDGTKELRIGSINYEWVPASGAFAGMGIFTRLCCAYDMLAYLESTMMPNTDMVADPGTAKAQYDKVVSELTAEGFYVAVSSVNNYNDNLFAGVTNNIEAYAQVFLDSRFDLSVVDGSASYDSSAKAWTGRIRVVQHTDGKNAYPADTSAAQCITVKVNDNELEFAKQKVHKALSKSSMADIDFRVADMTEAEMHGYFRKYSLERLKSFRDGYSSCISILAQMGQTTASDVQKALYSDYQGRCRAVESALKLRQGQADSLNRQIEGIQEEQRAFQYGGECNGKTYAPHDFYAYLGSGELYKEFCSYRREDTYTNSNYVSDGLTTSGCLAKAKELLGAAEKEVKKACMLQRTVSVSLGNLLMLPEFERLHESFALFNYIRTRADGELLKLRIIGIDFAGESPEKIEVTFSDQVKSIDGKMDYLRGVIKQANSMATSYPSTVLQAKQGSDAKGEISDMHTNGLNAAKTMLTNNDNNEVTITQAGILCKRMDDQGMYGDKQLRITGNIMAFTKDNWQSVEMAIGETTIVNPFTEQEENDYGILAKNIIGNLMASNKLFIGNKAGSVIIDSDGITISNGVIKSKDYTKDEDGNETGSIIDLRDGSFSFAGGGLTYDGDNGDNGDNVDKKMKVRGEIEALSIYSLKGYDLNSKGKQVNVLLGNYSNALNDIWSVTLGLEGYSQIDFHSYYDFEDNNKAKGEMLISSENITFDGNIYSPTGQITTSDRNMKDNVKPLTDKHMKFFSLLQPVSFTFTDGTSGRTHIGFISQDVEDAMEKSGLTDLDFAGFCKTVKTKEVIGEDGNKRYEAETDENGNPVYVYALRYEEFIALNTFMIQRLFEDNRGLRKEIQNLQEDMGMIKEKLGILD